MAGNTRSVATVHGVFMDRRQPRMYTTTTPDAVPPFAQHDPHATNKHILGVAENGESVLVQVAHPKGGPMVQEYSRAHGYVGSPAVLTEQHRQKFGAMKPEHSGAVAEMQNKVSSTSHMLDFAF